MHAVPCRGWPILLLVACASAGQGGGDGEGDDPPGFDAMARADAPRFFDAADVIDGGGPDAPAPVIDAAPGAIDATPSVDAKPGPIDAAPGPVDAAAPPADAGTPGTTSLYATSGTTLYRLNPASLAATSVGSFTGIGGDVINDLAVAPDGTLFGATGSKLFKINPANAACTAVGNLSQAFSALAFAPAGVVQPAATLLAASDGGQLYRVDTATAAVTLIGSLGGAGVGDLVHVPGVGLLVSFNPGGTNDRLNKVNPASGASTAIGSSIGFPWVWGLAWTGSRLIGVTLEGKLLDISLTTGVAASAGAVGFGAYGAAGG